MFQRSSRLVVLALMLWVAGCSSASGSSAPIDACTDPADCMLTITPLGDAAALCGGAQTVQFSPNAGQTDYTDTTGESCMQSSQGCSFHRECDGLTSSSILDVTFDGHGGVSGKLQATLTDTNGNPLGTCSYSVTGKGC